MKVAVTGGTGVIGSRAVGALVAAGHDVVALSRSDRADAELWGRGAEPVRASLFDVPGLAAAFEGADAVVNLASHVPVGRREWLPGAWRVDDRIRTEGVRCVLDAARAAGVRRMVQESVSMVYADAGDEWITEESALDITGRIEPCAVAEAMVQEFGHGLADGVVLRFGGIVGDDANTRSRMRHVRLGRPVGLGRPDGWAHLVHTDDLGGAVLAALRAPSGVYNVGAEPVRRQALYDGYAAAAEVPSPGFRGPVSAWLAGSRLEAPSRSLRVCSEHVTAQTGWQPRRRQFGPDWLTSPDLLPDDVEVG